MGENIGKCIIIIAGGIIITQVDGMKMLGYGISALGGLIGAMEFLNWKTPYNKLFESIGIEAKVKEKKDTDYGYFLRVTLPIGVSTNDFKKHQLAIEQNLNKKVEITYKNHYAYIKVYEKELDIPEFELMQTKNILEFPIGIMYGGEILTVNLERVVHLLIAGETGSGKSTLLRGILTSIMANNKRVSLHLIDLKNGAEFNVFRNCKQVKTFSRNIDEAEKVLMDLLLEVDKRYDLFFENNVVDIKEYNKLKGKKKLDYQICVIDEFADLQDEKGSISAIETLTAKARACGIHLIISTQRPDAKILNGRIKANVPGVIGLKTMNQINSRIIIDESGLENLRGKGQGIFRYGGLTEFQSMNISANQAKNLIKHTYVEKEVEEKSKEEIKDFGFLEQLK